MSLIQRVRSIVMDNSNPYDITVVLLPLNLPQRFGVFASILPLVRLH